MTKVQMAPGIPNEKSRTVRPVHGPAMIHLPLQVYALPFRKASVLSLQYTTVFPASLPDIPWLADADGDRGPVLRLIGRAPVNRDLLRHPCAGGSPCVESRWGGGHP